MPLRGVRRGGIFCPQGTLCPGACLGGAKALLSERRTGLARIVACLPATYIGPGRFPGQTQEK